MSDYDLTEKQKKQILQNSIERVINNTMGTLEALLEGEKIETLDNVEINHSDWNELKWLVCKLWDRERNTIFKDLQEKEKKG